MAKVETVEIYEARSLEDAMNKAIEKVTNKYSSQTTYVEQVEFVSLTAYDHSFWVYRFKVTLEQR